MRAGWAAVLLALCLVGPRTEAQPDQAVAGWGSVTVLGTPEGLARVADWPSADPDPARIVRELVRFANTRVAGPAAQRLVEASRALERLDMAAAALGTSPLRLESGDARTPLWAELFAALGYRLGGGGGAPVQAEEAVGAEAVALRQVLTEVGLPPEPVVGQLVAGEPTPIMVPRFEAPLPLGVDVWRRSVLKGQMSPPAIFRDLVSDRELGLLYVGLLGLDEETANLFAGDERLIAAARAHVVPFSMFSSSLRVDGGRLVSPGGGAADPLWARIMGAEPSSASDFIPELFRRDGGRAAWFYDAVARSAPAVQHFVLGTVLPPGERGDNFEGVYSHFRRYRADPEFLQRPFFRPDFDPEIALQQIWLQPNGTPYEPTSNELLRRALDTDDELLIGLQLNGAGSDALSASSYLDLVFAASPLAPRVRAQAIKFGQRVRAQTHAGIGGVAWVVRARARVPAIMAAVGRVDPTQIGSYSAAIRQADWFRERLQSRSAEPGIYSSILQFQAGMSIVQQMYLSGGVPQNTAEGLMQSLVNRQTLPDGDYDEPLGAGYYDGEVLEWIREQVLPTLRSLFGPEGDAESLVLRAMSGMRSDRVRPVFRWLDREYAADPAARDFERLRTVRSRQVAPRLDDAIAFFDATRGVLDAETDEALALAVGEFERAGGRIVVSIPPSFGRQEIVDAPKLLREAVSYLRRTGVNRIQYVTSDISVLLDHMTSAMLWSLAYAAVLPAGDDPLAADEDVWRRHDLGVFSSDRRSRSEIPWELPHVLAGEELVRVCPADRAWASCDAVIQDRPGTPWHVEGALVHLDSIIVPAPGLLAGPPRQNPLLEADQDALAQAAGLRTRPETTWSRAEVAAALALGRQRVDEGQWEPMDTLSWRAAAAPWLARQGRQPHELLTLTELLRVAIGRASLDFEGLEAWGGSPPRLGDCYCLRFDAFAGVEQLADRTGRQFLGVFTSNLRLRLAELMEDLALPDELLPIFVEQAIRDLRREPVSGDFADWFSVVRAMQSVDLTAISRYLAELSRTPGMVTVESGMLQGGGS